MNLACPSCSTVYRIDPERVPEEGAVARCRECDARFHVSRDERSEPGAVTTARPAREGAGTPTREPAETGPTGGPEPDAPLPDRDPAAHPAPAAGSAPGAPAFGPQDPATRARRLARALVSDMTVYNPEKWRESRDQGTLRTDFRDEILKSWDEYVEQVGERMAKRTPYFRDALNEILASGERVF